MSLFSLGGLFSDLWMDLWISLNSVVYQIIEWLYEVFELVANVNLFSEKVFNDFTDRIYIIVGIAMLFIFAYNIVLMIINPDDKKSTGNTTKIVKETIIALVLIILLPTVFRYMTVFQNHILSSHIIESIILGDKSDSGTEDCNFDNFTVINDAVDKEATKTLTEYCTKYSNLEISQKGAYLVAPTLFTAFFAPTDYSYNDCLSYVKGETHDSAIDTDDDKKLCAKYVYDVNMAKFSGGILPFIGMDGVYTDAMDDGFFDFNYLMAFIAGILAVYMFFCYTMEIGVRVAKLGFLQLISPIPVMLRIIPKQKEAFYDKWFKNLLNTYLDVFIRLAIIYFAMFAISLVPDVMAMLLGANYGKGLIGALAAVVVILGLLKFAQEAPALFKEFFGSSGRFALKSPKAQFNENKLAKGGIGAIGTMGAIGSKNIKDTVKNFKENGFKGGAIKTLKGMPRSIGQQFMGAYRGYKKGGDAQSFSDMRDGILGTAASELSKGTFVDKTKDFWEENKAAVSGFYKASYTSYNSPAELRKAAQLDEVAKKQSAFEALLDSSDQVKGVDSYYEGKIKSAQSSGATLADIQALHKDWRKAKNEARAQAYASKSSDIDVRAALNDYKEVLAKNLTVVNESLLENGKAAITNVETYLSDSNLTDVTKYANTREPGGAAKKSAANIRQKAMKEAEKTKSGNK